MDLGDHGHGSSSQGIGVLYEDASDTSQPETVKFSTLLGPVALFGAPTQYLEEEQCLRLWEFQ